MTTAAAPSLICDELPAVTEPLTWNAGRSPPRTSSDVSRRGPSSAVNATVRTAGAPPPFAGSATRTSIGTVSSSNRPASSAATARWWLRRANSSCSPRDTLDSRAWFSATSPVER